MLLTTRVSSFFRVYLKTVNMPKQRVFSGFQIDPNSRINRL